MNIQEVSTGSAQQKVQEQAAVKVERMALDAMKEQSVALEELMKSSEPITDPTLGKNLNLLA